MSKKVVPLPGLAIIFFQNNFEKNCFNNLQSSTKSLGERAGYSSNLILIEDNAAEGLVPKTRPQVDGTGAVHHLVRLDVLEPHLRQGEHHQLRES